MEVQYLVTHTQRIKSVDLRGYDLMGNIECCDCNITITTVRIRIREKGYTYNVYACRQRLKLTFRDAILYCLLIVSGLTLYHNTAK